MDSFFTKFRMALLFLGLLLGIQGSAKANDTAIILYDCDTGQILYEKNADDIHYPASLTKIMTLYLTFQALSKEQIGIQSQFPVSYNAASQEPSKLGLLPGQYITTHDLVLGVATNSSNDAATVLAEGLSGNVHDFAILMNQKAQQLGMTNTHYENSTGLPNPDQTTTARDMLKLSIALQRDFPEYYPIFGTRYFNYHGHQYRNHNHLLYNCEGVDGIKTGYIHAEGHNLVGSANRNGRRLLAIVLGEKSSQARDRLMRWLFSQGFDHAINFEDAPISPEITEKPAVVSKHKHHGKKHVGKAKKKKVHKKKKKHRK